MTGREEITTAMRDSIPIMVGYFFVAMAFGLFCARGGIPPAMSGLISLTNVSSSGQLAGVTVITSGGSWLQLALGVFLVNLRYVLMSISLGQRLGPGAGTWQRMLLAWGITDEIYALGMSRTRLTVASYLSGCVLPIVGWTSGTVLGGLVGDALPPRLTAAFGLLMYVMFVAIVTPVAARARSVLGAVAGGAGLSAVLAAWTDLASGWRIIVTALVVSAVLATIAPVRAPDEQGARA